VERDHIFRTSLTVPPSAWVAPSATLVGDVSLGERVSVWFGCVLRGDLEPISVGDETNLQDGTIVHVDRGSPARIGRRVTVGHRSVVHGCVVEDEATIGMGAVLLSGSRIGRGALVAASPRERS
jgi:carbonic anhydrase/acetyltransferase-like protein (isoleucine patch superfamily)